MGAHAGEEKALRRRRGVGLVCSRRGDGCGGGSRGRIPLQLLPSAALYQCRYLRSLFSDRRVPCPAVCRSAFGFEVLSTLGFKTDINRARVHKLYQSTNMVPKRLQEGGFSYRYDLLAGWPRGNRPRACATWIDGGVSVCTAVSRLVQALVRNCVGTRARGSHLELYHSSFTRVIGLT